MAAGRHIEICKKWNNSRTVSSILTKFVKELHLGTSQTLDESKPPYFKIQDGRRRKTEIYQKMNNFETVRPICTKFGILHSIHSAPGTGLWPQNLEIHNPRWPPAAIFKFTKTWITPEPFVRFLPNLAWSFVLTPPQKNGKTEIY